MPHRPPPAATEHVDEHLARLLEIEQRLEARVRDAERAAHERVEAARNELARLASERTAELEAMTREEERVDLERHAEQMRRIEADGEAEVARLSSVPDALVDQLARLVVARIIHERGAP